MCSVLVLGGLSHPSTLMPEEPVGGWFKRAFDICFSLAALIALAPSLLLIAIAIKIDNRGDAIFKQERGGFGGRIFQIWKFRTMESRHCAGTLLQTQRGDKRVTRLGRFLRKTSLDEFPQLVNVLLGDMSLVGPRPHVLAHDDKFARIDSRYRARTRARPGMTGLAQISGCRGPTETPGAIRARTGWDIQYVEQYCFALDVKILAKTTVLLWKDPQAF